MKKNAGILVIILAISLIPAGCINPFYTRVELTGRVIDGSDSSAVPSPILLINGNGNTLETAGDALGNFSVSVPLATYGCDVEVVISAAGYKTSPPFPVGLSSSQVYRVFVLEPTKETLIWGTVRDQNTDALLSGVQVTVKGRTVSTDTGGYYSVTVSTTEGEDSVLVQFSLANYEPKSATASTTGASYQLDVKLTPSA
ncbi:MAG: hypothetical protein ACM3WV_03755 [Bacillota bacterium]